MGWLAKIVVALVGLSSFGLGVWPLGLVCFAYLLLPLRPRKRGPVDAGGSKSRVQPRALLVAVFVLLALAALASGGTLSPIAFFSLAAVAWLWPSLPFGAATSRVIPVKDSILLRSALFPFKWHAVAMVKPGAEEIPRALSSYKGRLVVLAKDRAVLAQASAYAIDASRAEETLLSKLRESADSISSNGAYLLPLEGKASVKLLPSSLVRGRPLVGQTIQAGTDVIVLDSDGSFVHGTGAYKASLPKGSRSALPGADRTAFAKTLTWDMLSALGKQVQWPEPDSYSNFLESLHATKGEPISKRVEEIDGSGESIQVRALGGDSLELSRPQLRAIISMYG